MQLKLSSEEDQGYVKEIQKKWCLLLDKFEGMYDEILFVEEKNF